jgi:hypothetical protein
MLRYVYLLVALTLIVSLPVYASSQKEYALYAISFKFKGIIHTITLNETLASTSNKAWNVLYFVLSGENWTLSYSRSVNASHQFFPYVPSTPNQTLKYSSPKFTLLLSLEKNGTKQIQFQGSTYTLTTYSFVATYNSTKSTHSLLGEVDAFPSGLLYMAKASADNFALTVTLLSTNIPLTVPSASVQQQAASIIIGAGAVLVAIFGSFRLKRMRKTLPEQTPEHWVD